MQRLIQLYNRSAGALLLALAAALFVVNLSRPSDFVSVRDPIAGLPSTLCFWVLGLIALRMGLNCLFGGQTRPQLMLILWLSTSLIIYRVGMHFLGATAGMKGYLGEMAGAFGVSSGAMASWLTIAVGCLAIGSLAAITMVWALERMKKENPTVKMSCSKCGGHVEFPLGNLGRQIDCPHCHTSITLRQPDENMKMTCVLCGGHVEFPVHSLGHKIKCPHCKMDITLKQPA
jgi:DNA-directed RNA polymerase subunit RPC12/RpoP